MIFMIDESCLTALNNAEEEKRIEKKTKEERKEEIRREEDENGFREYKLQ